MNVTAPTSRCSVGMPYSHVAAIQLGVSDLGQNRQVRRGTLVASSVCDPKRRRGFAMNLIWSLITWAVFGLVIGAIARLLYPGRQPMSIWVTMALGIGGSFVGGFTSWAL